ncbi:MAG TPA: hypothetical protein VFS43_23355 [Polyangiaceae bacterium]|nr:hypothetical protein [Polyangiaceae bacterium]
MTRLRAAPALALASAVAAAPAWAAPMGPGVEAARVLSFHTDSGLEVVSKTMTNVLRQRVVDGDEFALNALSGTLVETALDAKCSLKGLSRSVAAADEKAFDAACLKRMSAKLGAKNFFWGLVYAEGGTTFVRLHFWRDGLDRAATLPYDAEQRDRIADRLYRKVVTPNAVGDLKIVGASAGELVVDGRPAGPYVSGVELTLETGEHFLEVRDGQRTLARGRARIEPGGRSEATLMAVAEPAPPVSSPPSRPRDPPPVVVSPRPSAWPWVLGGTAAAGFAGAGAFWVLRSGERRDLEKSCMGKACPPEQDAATGRVNTYATLSAVSLGVGVAAGAGLAAYLLVAKREPRLVGGVAPVTGGAALSLGGRF